MVSSLRGTLRLAWRGLLVITVLAAALVLLWHQKVIPSPWRTATLQKIRATEGLGFNARLPKPWPGFTFNSASGTLTEDGRALMPVNDNGTVREQGGGRFRVGGERVLFSTTDGSNATTNGRVYSLKIQTVVRPSWRVPIWIAGALALLLLFGKRLPEFARRWRAATLEHSTGSPIRSGRAWALMLFVLALGMRVGFLWLDPEYTDGQMSIRGTPYSDARDWNGMAKSTASGGGVDSTYPGMRALYPMFVASFYTWFGHSLTLAKGLQAVMGALSAAVVFLALRRSMPLWAALAAGAFFAIDPRQVTQAGKLMTEPFGLLLIMLSAWCTIVGGEQRRAGMLFVAGAFFACSNLARPLTLFAFPIYVALIAANGWLRESGHWRAALRHSTAFVLGTFVCLTPWIVRERVVHGIWAISCNSSSALFAASTPEFGVWKSGVEELAAQAGVPHKVKARYDYFQARFRENLERYPGFYARNVVRSFGVVLTSVENESRAFRGVGFAMAAVLIALGCRRGGWSRAAFLGVPAGLAASVIFLAPDQLLAALTLVGLGFSIWWRVFPGLVLLTCHFSGLLGSSLFGNPDLQRVRLLIDWIEAGWTFAGAFAVANLALMLIARVPFAAPLAGDRVPVSEAPSTWLRGVGWVFAAFLIVSSGRLVYRNAIHPAPRVPIRFTDAERATLLPEFARHFPQWQALADPALLAPKHGWARPVFAEFGAIENEVYSFRANDGLQHWSGLFKARPYARTSGVLKVVGGPFTGKVWIDFAGEIPPAFREAPCLIIGLTRLRPNLVAYLENTVEVVAIIPAPEQRPDFSKALLAPTTGEIQTLLQTPRPPQ